MKKITLFTIGIVLLTLGIFSAVIAVAFDARRTHDDATSVPVDKNFRITNIGNSETLGDPVTTVFPIYAFMCDIHEITSDNTVLRYSKIDFFISKEEINAPTVLLGSTPGGSAGSGECDLNENESSLMSKVAIGTYRIWAVRYLENKPDKRTIDTKISVVDSKGAVAKGSKTPMEAILAENVIMLAKGDAFPAKTEISVERMIFTGTEDFPGFEARITQDELPDDSVKKQEHTMDVKRQADGTWKVTNKKARILECYRGMRNGVCQ